MQEKLEKFISNQSHIDKIKPSPEILGKNQHLNNLAFFFKLKNWGHTNAKANMSNVTYLRLDGSVPPADRHEIVTKFNNDVSIDLLLLSTSVGE